MSYSVSPSLRTILKSGRARLLTGLTQSGGLRRLVGTDAPCGHLDADLLVGVVRVPEHQQSAVAYDVYENLLLDDLEVPRRR
jgi:hypothetical protein